jgi:hypothetical protein
MPPLFKVLVEGSSCHGGSAKYPKPGIWTNKIHPKCCMQGWHLTSDPLKWWKPKAKIWLAEGRGNINGDNSDKAAFESVRLIAKIDWKWPLLPMFPRVRAFLAASDRSNDPKADLSGADLSGAYLSGADLSRADLSRADLSGADLSRAYLSGADLSRAYLSGAYCPINPPDGWKPDENYRLVKIEAGT